VVEKPNLLKPSQRVLPDWCLLPSDLKIRTEFEKHLAVLLREADRVIFIDNVNVPLGKSAMLDRALTSTSQKVRILGLSKQVKVSHTAVFLANGINLTLKADLAQRRSVMASLDPNCEHPEDRDFRFDPVQRAKERWTSLVVAGLTALRAYIVAGKPKPDGFHSFGSFEQWNDLIRGCLLWCGYGDPCATRKGIIADDPEGERIRELLDTWWKVYGTDPVTTHTIAQTPSNPLRELLSDEGKFDTTRAGYQLKKIKDRVVGSYKLISPRTNRVAEWVLMNTKPNAALTAKTAVLDPARAQTTF
jgi:putative DNA primase/helicase